MRILGGRGQLRSRRHPEPLVRRLRARAPAALRIQARWERGLVLAQLSGAIGYTMVATGVGDEVGEGQREAYDLARKVYVPNVRYRVDIGDAFRDAGQARSRAWDYLP